MFAGSKNSKRILQWSLDRKSRGFDDANVKATANFGGSCRRARTVLSVNLPEILEPIPRHPGVARGVLHVAVTEIVSKHPRALAVVGELLTPSMPQHVQVYGSPIPAYSLALAMSFRTVDEVSGPLRSVTSR